MKKKLISLLLITSLALAGCGSSSENTKSTTQENEGNEINETEEPSSKPNGNTEETNDTSDLNDLGEIEVEKELFDVTLTIPADYVGETTQEELDKTAEENGYKSVTLNEDGSATYIMTKSQHKKLLEDIAASLKETIADMVGSEEYPNFTNIEVNDDFTSYTITTTSTELDMDESFSVMTLYVCSGMYGVFSGTSIDNVHVDFINADSGEIISSSDSADSE